jgi:hypothetical protein
MAAMETEQLDHDERADDGDVAVYRARAGERLGEIAREVKRRLTAGGLDGIPVFLLLPSSGSSIVAFGTPGDPDDATWRRVSTVVTTVIKELVGVQRVRSREMQCAATNDVDDRPSSIQSVESSAAIPEAGDAGT